MKSDFTFHFNMNLQINRFFLQFVGHFQIFQPTKRVSRDREANLTLIWHFIIFLSFFHLDQSGTSVDYDCCFGMPLFVIVDKAHPSLENGIKYLK